MTKAAWIGLGAMGYPMAGHLHKSGIEVTVFNRSPAKAAAWASEHGGQTAPTPKLAAQDADFIFACVGNDDDLRTVTTGPDGAFAAMKRGAIFIDHTTASANIARELSTAASGLDLAFLDCPVSGGESGAKNGVLTVMCGGHEAAFATAESRIKSYARTVRYMGPSGAGQLAKMCNQIAIAGLIQGLAEAIVFAERAGLDVETLIATISKGAAQSWQMENRWQTMHARQFDFGFAVEWMRKDLGICRDEAERNGAPIPVTDLVDRFYADVESLGGKRWDTSSLIARLDNLARASSTRG